MGTPEEQNCYIFQPVSNSSPLLNIVYEPFDFRQSIIRLDLSRLLFEENATESFKTYIYSFDSRRVKCMGVIKDMVVTLSQLPMKSVVLDVIVADIPPKFGMLFSRSWSKKLGGTLQMDLSYATIHVFGGEHQKMYMEVRLDYLVSDHENPNNNPIYVVEDELGSSIFHIGGQIAETTVKKIIPIVEENTENLV
jgi:hypothetical protein